MADYISASCTNYIVPKPRKEEEEDESTLLQRYKKMVSSLPKEEGTSFEKFICHFQGFWYFDVTCRGVLAVQNHFKARSTDIFIASTPKSGTTWIKALLFAIVTRSRYPMYNNPLLSEGPHNLVPFLEITLYHNQIPNLEILPSPRLFGTHIPYSSLPHSMIDSGCPIVYICRNPKDVFVSMWHFKNKMRANASLPPTDVMEAFEKFCEGVTNFGPFWDHVLEYWRASLERPQHVLFLKYEELQSDPVLLLKRLAQFVGCPFTFEEEKEGLVDEILRLCSFENLSNLEVNKSGKVLGGYPGGQFGNDNFFRKGKSGDWKNYLTSDMIERMDKITEEKFHGYGLKL